MAAAVLSAGSQQQGKMDPLLENPRTPSPLRPKDSLRSTSTTSSGAATDKIGLRVGLGGRFITDAKGQVKYMGGTWHLDSIPVTFKYADLVFRLTEKVNGAVSIKYLSPGDELDEDNLVNIWDDADVQEMYDEYMYSAQHSGAQSRAPRLKVFLFPATEEDGSLLTFEQDLDGRSFFDSVRYAKTGTQAGEASGSGSSLNSSYSGGAGITTDEVSWNQGSSRPSTHPSGVGMQFAPPDIDTNPFVAPWFSPGSGDNYSRLSSAMQRCMGPAEAAKASRALTFCTRPEPGNAGGNKENAFAVQLPTHLSIFGESPKLPSHISIFGDECSSEVLQQQQQHLQPENWQQQQQQMLGSKPPGLVGLGVMEAIGFQEPYPVDKLAGWQGNGGSHDGHEGWPRLAKAPSWMRIYSSITHVPKDAVTVVGSIAEGAFGEVSIARTPQFREVAVKWLKPAKADRHQMAFWREAELLSKLNHPNVLRMYGVVCESPQDPTIVGIMTEYIKGGSLTANLRRQRALLPLLLRSQIAVQIAQGMAFLHESNVVHFDLKPDNLLLEAPLQAQTFPGQGVPCVKVADFGLSKEKRQSYVSGVRDLRGTLPFMAPELVNDPDRITEKADVWSMGMLMWELLTLSSPFQDMAPNVIIAGLMKGTLRPEVPAWCEPSWAHLMRACWALDPAQRPSFRSMALELEHLLHLLSHAS